MDESLRTTFSRAMIVLSIAGIVGLPLQRVASSPILSVTNFGANGDAFDTTADTTQGSTLIHLTPTNQLSTTDLGKLILLFGAGPASTPTNQQDLVATIVSVDSGTNVTLSLPAGITTNQTLVTCGTQNANAFQACVNACNGTNSIVQIPAGRYLLVPPAMLDPNFVMQNPGDARPAVLLQTGGIHFLGSDRNASVLLGCGAWMLKGASVHRGWMFECLGPITNNAPLIFERLTFDGGVQKGRGGFYNDGPARTTDGAGWDVTHDAVVDAGATPLHAFKAFVNCTFTRWRGEMLKSVTSMMDGYIEVTNCAFLDGEASGFNFNFTHRITGCTFSNLDMAMEFYAGYMQNPSIFEGSTITNVRNAIVLVGALTNHEMPAYTVNGNSIAPSQTGILLGPARNITISSNQFFSGNIGVATDSYAYQGSGQNSNVVITANTFQNTGAPFIVAGDSTDSIVDMLITSNRAWNCGRFADGYGWSSNVVFRSNVSTGTKPGLLHSLQLVGQWFIDDASNKFPWYPNYDNPPMPCVITYANGMRQQLFPAATNSIFTIDQTFPNQIPPQAVLIITNAGKFPCAINPTPLNDRSAEVGVGNVLIYQWNNAAWKGTNVSLPNTPQHLRFESTQ